MCKKATAFAVAVLVWGVGGVQGQTPPDWRRTGNSSIDRSLAGLATGPVDRVQYSQDGSHLTIRTASGHIFGTSDFETWQPAAALSPAEPIADAATATLPEPGARIRTSGTASSPRLYAFGKFVYRSDDGGASWENLTAFRSSSIVGNDLQDLAVSPENEDEITVASSSGVFRSLDGGRSWSGLNQGLANLPAMRLLSLPQGDQGVRLALNDGSVVEWEPGQKQAWSPAEDTDFLNEQHLRQSLSAQRGAPVTAVASVPGFLYTGMANGTLSVSTDGGATWRTFAPEEAGAVERFWVDSANPRVALAVFGSRVSDPASPASPAVHVMRTQNGGVFWDDLTSNLPDTGAHGITADPATGAVYVASGGSVFLTYTDLENLGAAQPWTALPGLPQAAVKDVKLDAQGNQLWVALDGLGVYSTLAPHRLRDPRVVSSADFVARAAAPGSLVTVLGASVRTAHAGDLPAPVLDANDAESQIQIPFETRGTSVSLAINASNGPATLPAMPLETAAPSIFVDRDGSPLLLDSDSGIMLNAMTPAHSGAHIQILATGLGRVKPDWPTGLAAPLENPPQVEATVTAYLDREPVEVTRAVLAPYIGFYLVEVEIPKIVNYGPAELYIQAEGQSSNRVRVYIAP